LDIGGPGNKQEDPVDTDVLAQNIMSNILGSVVEDDVEENPD